MMGGDSDYDDDEIKLMTRGTHLVTDSGGGSYIEKQQHVLINKELERCQ
jgi:hypothetical protein